MDEKTPHFHATVVPIVTGERRKTSQAKERDRPAKKYRKKNPNRPRLCADDVMNRTKLKEYQDTYALMMAKYGLQRGVDGSKARHISTREHYRQLGKERDSLKSEVEDWYKQRDDARDKFFHMDGCLKDKEKRLAATEQKILQLDKTVWKKELKAKTANTLMKAADRVGTLFNDTKGPEYQRQIGELQKEIAEKDAVIRAKDAAMGAMEARHEKEVKDKDRIIAERDSELDHLHRLFPYLRNLLKLENFLRVIGFAKDQVKKLFRFETVEVRGELYSNEFNRSFNADGSTAKLSVDEKNEARVLLHIDGKDHVHWFREKRRENIPEWEKSLEPKDKHRKCFRI